VQTSTVILVSAATALNLSVWYLSRPTTSTRPTECGTEAVASDTAAALPSASTSISSEEATKGAVKKVTAPVLSLPALPVPDQPWLSTVHDAALQIAQSPKVSDALTLSHIECQGSKCEISGSTKVSSDGQAHGSSDVARLLKAMNEGQVAGGDTGRWAGVTQIAVTSSAVRRWWPSARSRTAWQGRW
jgi:hypothetical protein